MKAGPAASAGRIERGHVDMDAVALILQGDARKGGDVQGEEGVSRTPSSEMMEEGEMWEAWWGETEGEQERSLAPYTGEVRRRFQAKRELYIYIYICIHIYICIYMNNDIYIYTYICIYIDIMKMDVSWFNDLGLEVKARMWEVWWGETEGEQERSLAPYTGEVDTLHPTPHIRHPTPYTLHSTPDTLHPTLHIRPLTPYTLHATP